MTEDSVEYLLETEGKEEVQQLNTSQSVVNSEGAGKTMSLLILRSLSLSSLFLSCSTYRC